MAEHAPNGNGRIRIDWQTLAITVITWVVLAMAAYGAVDARVKVLEDRYNRMVDDMREIKADVKILLQRATP